MAWGFYRPEDSGWKWPHFKPKELACKHCGVLPDDIDSDLLDRLELLRNRLQQPLRINSGHRCRQHNLLVGGEPYSQHKSLAVDISLVGLDPLNVYTQARACGFLGIGLGTTFIHLDMRRPIDGHIVPHKLTVWYYPGSKEKWDTWLANK